MSNAESAIGSRLDADRRDLLDLSLRNPLLNFRTRERFRLRATEDGTGHNLSLAARLAADFAIELPEAPDEDELDVEAYFDRVRDAIGDRPGWSVGRDAVALGFFSFGKFLMYRDLD